MEEKKLTQDQSKVEVTGFEAKYYDMLMNIITLGTYPFFIRNAIKSIGLKKGEKVLDFGAGTGRNDCLMLKYIGKEGKITGIEIGEEMSEKFKKNCKYPNVTLLNKRIDEPLGIDREYDTVFISFVLHGFIQEKRDVIIDNAYKALKEGGKFAILDYNEFDPDKAFFIARYAIKNIECPLAEDFIKRNWKQILSEKGFKSFNEAFFYKKYVRLLIAYK